MWIELTEAQVQTWLSSREWETFRTVGLVDGQDDPLPDVIAAVVGTIRGYVAGCPQNVLGVAGTIPDELLSAARALFPGEFALRVPGAAVVIDELRRRAADRAMSTLKDVAGCRFKIEPPTTAVDSPAPPSFAETGGNDLIDFSEIH